MMDHRLIDLITYAYDDETKTKILQSYKQKDTLLDVDLFQEHLMVQPVLAVIILTLTLASFLILLFSIIFIGCRALGKCGAKRYQPHPTSGKHYSAHLVIFLCSWFLMATASSYYAYCGTHLWHLRPSVIPTTLPSEVPHDIQKRSAKQQSVFDLFDNPDYQGDFEQIEGSTTPLAFVTDKVEKSIRPRFPLSRLPRVDDSSEDSPPAVEQLPIFPINFTSRVPLASTVISPIEIPARPKAELDFKRLLDGEKLVTSDVQDQRRGEHMSGAFVGDGLPRSRSFINPSMKRPMSSWGTPTFKPEEVSAEMNPGGKYAERGEDEPVKELSVVDEQNSIESSTFRLGDALVDSERNSSKESESESVMQIPEDIREMNGVQETLETSTQDVIPDTTVSEILILSMNDDEPETTEMSLDSTVPTVEPRTLSEESRLQNVVEERTTEISPPTAAVALAPAQDLHNLPNSQAEEITVSNEIVDTTASNEIAENTLNNDETTSVSLPESTISEEVTTLESFRSDEVLSTSRPIEESSVVTSQQSGTSTSPMDLSTVAIEENRQNVVTEKKLNSASLISNETVPSVAPHETNYDPSSTTTTTSTSTTTTTTMPTTTTTTDGHIMSTSRTSVMTESTHTPMTTDGTTTARTQELSLEHSEDDLSNVVSDHFESQVLPKLHERLANETQAAEEEKEEDDYTDEIEVKVLASTLSPTITVLNTKSQSRRPTTVHTFPQTPLDETERRSITELLASPNLHPFRSLNTIAVVWIHRITFVVLSFLVMFVLPCSLILILIGTICYIRSYHPMDRSKISEKIGQLTVLLAVLFLFSLPIFILYIALVLSYNHVYNSICPDVQLQYQQHLGLLVGSSFNTLSSNSHRLIANTENCFRSQEPISGLWMSAAVFVLSALPFVFSLFKLSKYFLRMKTEYYWTISDYGTIYAKRALHTDAIYGNIYGTVRSKRPTSRPPPAPHNENAIYGESPVYGTYSAFGHM